MDIFLIGFSSASSAEGTSLEIPGAKLIRDWSSLTADDTTWGVVVDVPDVNSAQLAAGELGFEIRGMMRLVPDRPHDRPHGDWVRTMIEVLPSDPPPLLGELIVEHEARLEPAATLLPNGPTCEICGWIGEHDPNVDHHRSAQ